MKIIVLPGDGIGEEITTATMRVLEAADGIEAMGLDYEFMDIGFKSYDAVGTTFPDEVEAACRASDGIILGPISHMDYPDRDKGGVNVSAAVRIRLDLYANVRPARSRPGLPCKGGDFDLVIMRECTEGFYPDRNMYMGKGEFMPDANTVISMRKLTRPGCRRIALRAFELAMTRRKKVTAIHKANNFIMSDGLFLDEVRKVAADFPDVELEEQIIDASAALLVRDPSKYDVICATNFHADILSDLASELSGSLGLAGSVNAGDDLCCAQAQHGSAPDIAGQDKANPISLILSASMLVRWLGDKHGNGALSRAADRIDAAVDAAIADPATRTADLGGTLGTRAFTDAVIANLTA
ncbi:MAG: isocitrate/isopropylmalate dehydrogenase family protein [Rhodospirillaceae bacterium]